MHALTAGWRAISPHSTYPYFHDGEAETLTEAVDVMGRLQVGKQFSTEENAKIVAFCPRVFDLCHLLLHCH